MSFPWAVRKLGESLIRKLLCDTVISYNGE